MGGLSLLKEFRRCKIKMANIYKYLPIDDYSFDSLKNKYLWFSKPPYFNDPFDCNLELFEYYQNFSPEGNKELVASLKARAKDFGICCFSRRNDNLHMWALYGNSHAGICLEYDHSLLKNCYSSMFQANCDLVECDYRDHPIDLDGEIEWQKSSESVFFKPVKAVLASLKDFDKLVQMVLLQKQRSTWFNEEELRIIISGLALKHGANKFEDVNKKGYKIPLPQNALRGIILGNKVAESCKLKIQQIIQEVYNSQLSLQKVELDYKDWKLNIKDL